MDGANSLGFLARDVVARQALCRPRALAIADLASGRRLSFADLDDLVRRCDGWLRGRQLPSGGRVAILARNGLHHAALFYGCPRADAVFLPLNWRLSGPELAGLLEDARPDVLIYQAEFEAEARMALAAAPTPLVLRVGPGCDELDEALAASAPLAPRPMAALAPALLLYTSGTTGRPKGVVVTNASAFYGALNFTFVGELTAGHAMLCDTPLFHVVGLLAILHASMLAGAAVHLADRFTPGDSLARFADLGISHYFCVPQMAQAIAQHPAFAETDLTGLRLFTGGAPMPSALTVTLLDKGIRASNGYGMSENGTVLGVPLDPEIARRKLGSVGVASPVMEVRLVGPDGRDVADGEAGEVWLRSPAVTTGYWNQPAANAAAFSDGWFRTGDAARRDADGFYFIIDRWKDMYITGGENVYPAEVEAVLLSLDGVADAAVVGFADPRWGESGCAYLCVEAGAAVDTGQVLAWCGERLAGYKNPRLVRFIDALPRTASGKVKKDVLRQAIEAEMEGAAS